LDLITDVYQKVGEGHRFDSSEEDSNKKGRMPTGDIKEMLHYWEEFQSGYKVASQQS
jgi:hypothetical protein